MATFDDIASTAVMVPMLPCLDVDAMAAFWTAPGLERTYRQIRPHPYVILEQGTISLHYYGMDPWDPAESHSSCAIAVVETRPLYERFAQGSASCTARFRSPASRASRGRASAPTTAGSAASASSTRPGTGSCQQGRAGAGRE
ncbi:hypothetical protein [Xylanimonas sp. McL0601]|uniref:hypothetical protein n=1 Tax=Xylanimonas sp. McL0601 TaxID=3414739 RepID=UPI003CE9CFAD